MFRNHLFTGRVAPGCFALAVFLFANTAKATAQCGTTSPTGAVTWTTQWCDEFNGTSRSAINSSNWTYDTGNSGFGNNELENYCDPSSNVAPCSTSSPNAYIDGTGHLAIQVMQPSNNVYTSARLKSQGLQTFHAGRLEAGILFPSHTGLWPAFWLLGAQGGVSWPTVGESDIMENWPTTSNIPGPGATGNCSTIHSQLTDGPGKGQCFTFPAGQRIDTAFHVYGQIWSANMIQYYIDDASKPFFVVTAADLAAGDSWPFSSSANPFFIIMNVAVGGTLGAPTDSATGSQPPMLIDYVRQYVPSPVSTQLSQPGAIAFKAGATSGNTANMTVSQAQGTGRTTFSCTTTAPKASCVVGSSDAVNSHTVDFTGGNTASATITVTTTANTSASGISYLNWTTLAGGFGVVLLAWLIQCNATKLRMPSVACVVLLIGMWPACGGASSNGGGNDGGGGGSNNGTTPGSYTVTVNAYNVSSTDSATPNATATFNVTVN